MNSDSSIKRIVEHTLQQNPDLDASAIEVTVKNGVVTLAGFVPSYSQIFEAEHAVKKVAGVANIIRVHLPEHDERPDPELAREAVNAMEDQLPASSRNIRVVVRDGWITLEGEVGSDFHRERAEAAVRQIKAVQGMVNSILVRPKVSAEDLKKRIAEAFMRDAQVDGNWIRVEVHDDEVVLNGTVHAWFERGEAERLAWSTPEVKKVVDKITVMS
jgi:osmotically-inducible protein OsmY